MLSQTGKVSDQTDQKSPSSTHSPKPRSRRNSKRSRSEDKVSLVENGSEEDEVFTPPEQNGHIIQSDGNAIRNVDLLQVPSRDYLTSSDSETDVTPTHPKLKRCSQPLPPLTLQIPDPVSVYYSNGGPKSHIGTNGTGPPRVNSLGEQTPLLIDGQIAKEQKSPATKNDKPLKIRVSSYDEDEANKRNSKCSSVYSKLNGKTLII